jgi:hypothetical protein
MTNFIELHDLPAYPDMIDQLKTIVDMTANQYCITCPPGHTDDVFYGTGSMKYDWSRCTINEDGSREVPLRDKPLKESDFTDLCDAFKGTAFEDIYHSLSQKYKLGRIRIMIMEASMCLTWHKDGEERIHYPIKTQEGCFMVIEDEVKYLEQDKWYYTKTMKNHTAFNASNQQRIHLVANILGVL